MGRKKKKRKGRRSQAEDLQRIKKKTLFRGGDNSSLPTFDPHRPVTLPNQGSSNSKIECHFMKKVDPTIDENAYSINEEAQLADSSSHMFGVHFRGALFIPNGSTWDGNKLLKVRAEARRRMKKYEKKKKKARREQRRRDRNEKFLLSGGVL